MHFARHLILWKRRLDHEEGRRYRRIKRASLAVGFAIVLVIGLARLHGFLAIEDPHRYGILVIERWFPTTEAMREAATEYRLGNYDDMVCVSVDVPPPDDGPWVHSARRAADRLAAEGIDPARIIVLDLTRVPGSRTFGSALAVRAWQRENRPASRVLDVFTVGVHARKSRLAFRRAFGESFSVGSIASTERDYPPDRWLLSPTGIYLVFRNAVGWLHTWATEFPEDENATPVNSDTVK